jgi:hypothetical protein
MSADPFAVHLRRLIAGLTWAMVMDSTGEVGDVIALPNVASKGKGGGRTIPLNTALRESLVALKAWRGTDATPWRPIILKRCGGGECGGAPPIESDRYSSKSSRVSDLIRRRT